MKKAQLPLFVVSVLSAALLLLQACSTSSGTMADVSADMASLAAAADRQAFDNASNAVDESSVASESSGARTMVVGLGGSRLAVDADVTVTHSYPGFTGKTADTLASDVVTVKRCWTAADGAAFVDIVQRPEIPSEEGFYSTPVTDYAPGIEAEVGLEWNGADSGYLLRGNSVRTVDGVLVSSVAITMSYAWDEATGRATLRRITKEGESVSLLRGDARLDTAIYYRYDEANDKDSEYLRTIDWVSGAGSLRREVHALDLDPAGAAAIVASSGSWTGSMSVLPGLDGILAVAGTGTLDILYWTDPGVAGYSLDSSDPSTYPVMDAAQWLRAVITRAAPRDVAWFKPIAEDDLSFVGNYVRRLELVKNGSLITTSVYSLDDGTTVVRTGSATRFVSAADGAVTTKWNFADGRARSVRIEPTSDGYRITRSGNADSQTYGISYGRDDSGGIVSITVTNEETGQSTTYTEGADGTWN